MATNWHRLQLKSIRTQVEAIRKLNEASPERSHEDWDALYKDILSDIACHKIDSLDHAAAQAREALLLEEMDLTRWYA